METPDGLLRLGRKMDKATVLNTIWEGGVQKEHVYYGGGKLIINPCDPS